MILYFEAEERYPHFILSTDQLGIPGEFTEAEVERIKAVWTEMNAIEDLIVERCRFERHPRDRNGDPDYG
jgi:hypothetical protein